jgi:hypothetical protein
MVSPAAVLAGNVAVNHQLDQGELSWRFLTMESEEEEEDGDDEDDDDDAGDDEDDGDPAMATA